MAGTLVTGCGNRHRLVGQVTTFFPRFCVGAHAATGNCFAVVAPGALTGLRLGNCVEVRFSGSDPDLRADAVRLVSATTSPRDCQVP